MVSNTRGFIVTIGNTLTPLGKVLALRGTFRACPTPRHVGCGSSEKGKWAYLGHRHFWGYFVHRIKSRPLEKLFEDLPLRAHFSVPCRKEPPGPPPDHGQRCQSSAQNERRWVVLRWGSLTWAPSPELPHLGWSDGRWAGLRTFPLETIRVRLTPATGKLKKASTKNVNRTTRTSHSVTVPVPHLVAVCAGTERRLGRYGTETTVRIGGTEGLSRPERE